MLYSFLRRKVGTSPGTGNYAFQPFQTLPLHSPGGPGITYLRGMQGIQERQLFIEQSQIIDGFNGLETGSVVSQSLTSTDEAVQASIYMYAADPAFASLPGNSGNSAKPAMPVG